MKKSFRSVLAVAAAVLALVACQKEEAKSDPSISVNPTSASIEQAGGSVTISVTSNTSWTAASDATWLTVSPASGNGNGSVTLSADENESGASRTAKVTFTAGTAKAVVNVGQQSIVTSQKFEWAVCVSETEGVEDDYIIAAEGETLLLAVSSTNVNWEATCDCDWGEFASKKGGSTNGLEFYKITIPANDSEDPRTITIDMDVDWEVYETTPYVITQAGNSVPAPAEAEWALIGVNGDWSNEVTLEEDEDTGLYFVKGVTFSGAPEFKIRAAGDSDWALSSKNLGLSDESCTTAKTANYGVAITSHDAVVADGGDDSHNIYFDVPAGTYDIYLSNINWDETATYISGGLVYLMEEGQEPGYINPSALEWSLKNDGEVLIWEGPLAESGWANNEMKPNTMFSDAGIKAGGKVRFYIVPNGDWWAMQLYDGHWINFSDYDLPELGGGNNVGNQNDYLKDGVLEIELTAALAIALKSNIDWGYAFITQGQDCYLTHITYVAPAGGDEDPNMIENGDFEAGVIAPFTGWQETSTRAISEKGQGHESDYCLVLTNLEEDIDESTNEAKLWAEQCYVDGLKFEVGKSYDVEFWAKSATDGATLQVEMQETVNWGGNYPGQWQIGTEWAKYTCTATITDIDKTRFTFDFGGPVNTLWIDDVKVTPVATE